MQYPISRVVSIISGKAFRHKIMGPSNRGEQRAIDVLGDLCYADTICCCCTCNFILQDIIIIFIFAIAQYSNSKRSIVKNMAIAVGPS